MTTAIRRVATTRGRPRFTETRDGAPRLSRRADSSLLSSDRRAAAMASTCWRRSLRARALAPKGRTPGPGRTRSRAKNNAFAAAAISLVQRVGRLSCMFGIGFSEGHLVGHGASRGVGVRRVRPINRSGAQRRFGAAGGPQVAGHGLVGFRAVVQRRDSASAANAAAWPGACRWRAVAPAASVPSVSRGSHPSPGEGVSGWRVRRRWRRGRTPTARCGCPSPAAPPWPWWCAGVLRPGPSCRRPPLLPLVGPWGSGMAGVRGSRRYGAW